MKLLRHLFTIALLLAAAVTATAATDTDTDALPAKVSVDLDAVRRVVRDTPDTYTALLNRFVAGDSTLTVGDMAVIYYGYAFTPDFDPKAHYDKARDAYKRKDYAVASYLSSEALVKNPVSLDMTVVGLVSATRSTVDRIRAKIPALQSRFDMLATIILSSGMGTNCESPFMIISADDIERIVHNVLGAADILGTAKVGDIDAVKIRFAGQDREHILYFNVIKPA